MKDLKSLIADLREKANAAAPTGPWHAVGLTVEGEGGDDVAKTSCGLAEYAKYCEANAEHIAACDPQTILRLCDELDGAIKLIERFATFERIPKPKGYVPGTSFAHSAHVLEDVIVDDMQRAREFLKRLTPK